MTERIRQTWRHAPVWVKWCAVLGLTVGLCTSLAFALDTDDDGMDDEFESFFGLDPFTNDAALNPDNDSLDNLAESLLWTDPFIVDTDRDGFSDGMDSNPVSRAVIPWGDPIFTRTNDAVYTWPDWMVSAFKNGGAWQTSAPCWWVSASETGLATLNMEVDRCLLTNDLRLLLPLTADSNATLFMDLYDSNESVIVSNLGNNLLVDVGTGLVKTLSVSLSSYTNAVGIKLRREAGEVSVGETLLYVDMDGDGLDADQETQLGTSDLLADTDDDGFSDYAEVQAGTDPLNAANHSPTLPAVNNGSGTSNVMYNTATLQGTLASTGCAPTTVFCYWGRINGGTNAAAWSNSVSLGIKPEGSVSCTVTGLLNDTTYRYRYAATNLAGVSWATSSVSFATIGTPYKMPITFSGYTRGEMLTNFPVMVVFSNNVGGSDFNYNQMASPNGYDLRFTNSTGTTNLNYEIEKWDTNEASVVWVQVPLLTNNASIWACWGDPGNASTPEACTTNGSTWDSSFRGVWHMTQTNTTDSTTNHFNAASYGNTNTPGKIAGAQGFNGSASQVLSDTLNPTAYTISAFIMPADVTAGSIVDRGKNDSGNFSRELRVASSKIVHYTWDGASRTITGTTTINTGAYYYVAGVAQNSSTMRLFVNGFEEGSPITIGTLEATGDRYLVGRRFGGTGANYFKGVIDELRIETVVRSSNWVWACWMNMASNQLFNSYGVKQSTGAPKDSPWIVSGAAASPSTVTGMSSVLTVLGGDNGGEENLAYTWTTNGAVPAAVAFSVNGNNAAKTTTATFSKAGSYSLKATIQNWDGMTITSAAGITVCQTLSGLNVISPSDCVVTNIYSKQFTVNGLDQFGNVMNITPTWSVSGGGIIDASGRFTAISTGGIYTVSANSGGFCATATVEVVCADLGPDTDMDGLADSVESGTGVFMSPANTGTSSTNWDSDLDGLGDGAEARIWGTDPNCGDTDNDGLSDGAEVQAGTNPLNWDTDGDGFPDGVEVQAGTDPLDAANHPPTLPVVSNIAGATNVTYNTATLQGNVADTGCAPTTVFCYWGRVNGGTNVAAWSNSVSIGIKPEGSVSCTITGLSQNATYRYRYAATNVAGTGWATSSVTFATTGNPHQMPITFSGYTRGESLTNFPVLVVFSNNVNGSGFNYNQMASSNGYDLRFTNSTSNALNYEIEKWDTNGVSIVWLQVPVLTSNANVWALWGDATLATSPAACTTNGATWSANYAGVYHLSRTNSSGVTPTSVGTNNGTLVNVPSTNVGVAGKIAGAFDFMDINDYVNVPSTFGLMTSNATLSCWVNLDSTSESGAFIKIGDVSHGGYGIGVGGSSFDNSGNKLIMLYEGLRWIPTSVNIGTGWHHVVMVVDGSGYPRAYLDGVSVYNDTSSTKPTTPGVSSGIGGYVYGQRYVDATIDEIEISSVPRSSNWVWACWMNQASNQLFSSYGAAQQTGTPRDSPWIATEAAATPGAVTGTNTVLTVLGGDNGGEESLTYSWMTNGAVPAPVTFSVNGNNAAKTTTAIFSKAGSYSLKATIQNWDGMTTSSVVVVTVNQTLKELPVNPSYCIVTNMYSRQFTVSGLDQFGVAMNVSPTWSLSGGGMIDANGRFTAISTGGTYNVLVDSGGICATAHVEVVSFDVGPDADMDGLADSVENGTGVYLDTSDTGTSSTNWDSDYDGLGDGAEVRIWRTDPNNPDTNAPTAWINFPSTNVTERIWIP